MLFSGLSHKGNDGHRMEGGTIVTGRGRRRSHKMR